jgi:hypothetical protein
MLMMMMVMSSSSKKNSPSVVQRFKAFSGHSDRFATVPKMMIYVE